MATVIANFIKTPPGGPQLVWGDDIALLLSLCGSSKGAQVAAAGGGAVNATKIAAYITEFTTVATTNDSAILPPAIGGSEFTVINSGAQTLRLFCQTSNQANANAAADAIITLAGSSVASIDVAANAVAVVSCATTGRYKSQVQ